MPTIIIIIIFFSSPTQTQTRHIYSWVLQQQYIEEKKNKKMQPCHMNEEYYSNMKANWRKIIQKMPIRDCMGFELWRMNRGFLSVFFLLFGFFSSSYNLILFPFILLVFYFLRNVLKRVVLKRMDWWFWLVYWYIILIMYGFSFPFENVFLFC